MSEKRNTHEDKFVWQPGELVKVDKDTPTAAEVVERTRELLGDRPSEPAEEGRKED